MSRRTALAALTALAAGCSRLSFFAANAPTVFGAYHRHADIPYGNDPQHRLDVYVPTAASGAVDAAAPDSKPATASSATSTSSSTSFPTATATPASAVPAGRAVIVFWHGGRWSVGDKSDYRFVGAALAECGYLVVVANYRHYPQVKMQGFMEDTARAATWALAHAADFGGDAAHLYLMGHSSGAHMAALVTLDPRYFRVVGAAPPPIAGVIGLSGPYDFLPLQEAYLQDMFGPPQDYALSQPINFVSAAAPPFLLVHGLADKTVWPKNSRNLAAALREVDVPVTLKLYPHRDHADTVAALATLARHRMPTLSDITTFVGPPFRA